MKSKLSLLLLTIISLCSFSDEENLEHNFLSPPESVKTSVYWYWMCGNISKEGVVKDLEEMKRVGINRVFIGHNYFDPYEGGRNVRLMSDEWWEVMHTALKKASELNIEVGIFNCPGWTQAGGPWIKPSQSMRYLTSSELDVEGPAQITVQLEKPSEDFQDVKVIAYPFDKSEQIILNGSNADIKTNPEIGQYKKIFDGDNTSDIQLPQNVNYCIDIKANNLFTARSLTIYPSHSEINAFFELQAKIKNEYQKITDFVIDWHNLSNIVGFQPFAPVVITLDEIKAKEFRLLVKNKLDKGGIAEIKLSSAPRIENYAAKTFAKMFQDPLPLWDYYMWREQPEVSEESLNVDPTKVIDISKYMSNDGTLTWDVPKGNWKILRMGMRSTQVTNNPAGPDGTGLEVDKMNKEHIQYHFNAYIGKILERIPKEDRKTFKVVIQDSYESGGQNFTEGFLQDFEKRYGYDPLPYLPTYQGYVIGNREESDRFLWDMRRLVADKIAYDYVGGFRELCHKHGLTTWLENYGHWGFPAEFLMYGGQSDEVGGEYWIPSRTPSWENNLGNIENRAASSCAHIYGKNLVSAESNTSGGPAFSHIPAETKQRMDKYFSEGINNTLLHVYVHQPDTDRYPGTNAWFGTEFNRANTWFSHIDLYIDYIKRCNYMLRQGLNIADVAYFIGEDVPKMTGVQDPILPKGYQFDYINAEVLVRDAFVKDGLITLPHGTAYRVLVLPKIKTMRPEVLMKIKQLVKDGAIVLGPAPLRSPSLQNQPEADKQILQMAKELWQGIDGKKQTFAVYGRGKVFDGIGLQEVFKQIDCIEDCKIPEDIPFKYNHRQMEGVDIYFLTNQSDSLQQATLSFRVANKIPELWNPIDGRIRELSEYVCDDGAVSVPIQLDRYESIFVVFKEKASASLNKSKNYPRLEKVAIIDAPWNITFKSKLKVPSPIYMEKLSNLSNSSLDSIKYFSGNMIYTTTFSMDTVNTQLPTYLDLGEVNIMAKVWINDQYVGGVWTYPYRINISSAIKKGTNNIRIDVVNTWVNRMIGDSRFPKSKLETWVGMNPYKPDSTLPRSGLIGPIIIYKGK